MYTNFQSAFFYAYLLTIDNVGSRGQRIRRWHVYALQ